MPYSNPNDPRRLEKNRAWSAANADKVKAYKQTYVEKNRELIRERQANWVLENKEKVAAYRKKWRENNKGTQQATVRNRQVAKIKRTPSWLTVDDKWMMRQAYELAALRTKMFGFPWHVDHIIPLRGKTVSGLHVPTNLQVIPGLQNCKKANKI